MRPGTLTFRLTLAGRFRAPRIVPTGDPRVTVGTVASLRRLGRLAIACLIGGVGLLNGADAGWAHAAGVVCLLGFVVLGFCAIVVPGLDAEA